MLTYGKWCLLLVILALFGCSTTPSVVKRNVALQGPPAGATLYVVPFVAIMVPQEVVDGIFDRMVDELNATAPNGSHVVILKRDLKEIGSEWLADKYYLTGELYGYVRDSGCCSTEMRLRVRVNYHQPGSDAPTLTITCPRDKLFDHDTSSFEVERQLLIDELSRTLVGELRRQLDQTRP